MRRLAGLSGFAALQCGEAPPHRHAIFILEAMPPSRPVPEAEPQKKQLLIGKAKPYRTGERQSRELENLTTVY
jgi:hypothetical protein